MSELNDKGWATASFRKLLMTSVSAAALLLSGAVAKSEAADSPSAADQPTVWISVSAQGDQLDAKHETFVPGFFSQSFAGPHAGAGLDLQKSPRLGFDLEAAALFQPHDSDWSFSASLRYGRALNARKTQLISPFHSTTRFSTRQAYYNAAASNRENHTIVDFKVGRDVGLGMFGHAGQSSINFGIRFAQFGSVSHFYASSGHNPTALLLYANHPAIDTIRSFRGTGPALSWDGHVPFAGNEQTGELTFDWGISGALLFGKQKISEREDSVYQQGYLLTFFSVYRTETIDRTRNRARSVVVPNPGGFAGISFRWPSAKLSVGYRADFFLGAIDGGVDARKNYDRDFYGPFATISIGLGG